jgi:sulfur-oxidizing protein SoxB
MDFAVKNSKTFLIVGIFLSTIFLSTWVSADKNIKVITLTLMQMGDLHGELQSRPNLREDAVGSLQECGVARLYTVIEQIRSEDRHALLFNIGDTLQGGAEFLFTQGQAIVDIFDKFKINAYASGNWDFLYGKRRYLELFRK